jgi:acyl-CoA reductase-like NAD-dependent aldehyde dehydrogenase
MTSSAITQPQDDAHAAIRARLGRDVQPMLIDGRLVPAADGDSFDTIDPTTEQVVASVARGGSADVDHAVAAARRALDGPWSRLTPHERARMLRTLAESVETHAEELAELESVTCGMPITASRQYIRRSAVLSLHYFASAVTQLHGETPSTDPSAFRYTLRGPVGVCGAITPWNAPIPMAAWKIGPALAAGNTLVLKPAEQTPLTALRLGELALEAGIPDGVLNIVTGLGAEAGAALAAHPGVDKIAFTGSTGVGRSIVTASAGNLKRVSLELGGKSPHIVFADADLSAAAPVAARAFTTLSGQACIAGSRLLVQESILDEFVSELVKYVSAVQVGDPMSEATDVGPLVSGRQRDRVRSYLDAGAAAGARVLAGAHDHPENGYFVAPTVFVDVNRDMSIVREEIFGPVVVVIPFVDEDDAVRIANDTIYGLAAGIWTTNVHRVHRMARRLQAGTIWVNTYHAADPTMPFGGYKESGYGRENGSVWYEDYTEVKSVFVRLDES